MSISPIMRIRVPIQMRTDRLLFVCREKVVQKLVVALVEHIGSAHHFQFTVDSVDSTEEALSALSSRPYDLVMAAALPVSTAAPDLIRQINMRWPATHCVLLQSSPQDTRGLRLDGVLSMPFEMDQFAALVFHGLHLFDVKAPDAELFASGRLALEDWMEYGRDGRDVHIWAASLPDRGSLRAQGGTS